VGLSSFNVFSWTPKDAFFVQQSAYMSVQGRAAVGMGIPMGIPMGMGMVWVWGL